MKRIRSDSVAVDIEKEFANAGIHDADLLEAVQRRESGRDASSSFLPLHLDERTAVGTLCYVFFDLLASGAQPVATLKEFLALYNQESLDTVEVRTTILSDLTPHGTPEYYQFESEIMPKKALEYLNLVRPMCMDYDDGVCFTYANTTILPVAAERSIPAEKWLKHYDCGRWRDGITRARATTTLSSITTTRTGTSAFWPFGWVTMMKVNKIDQFLVSFHGLFHIARLADERGRQVCDASSQNEKRSTNQARLHWQPQGPG
jgi:hypothetical protein